jgi:hypothetical protein
MYTRASLKILPSIQWWTIRENPNISSSQIPTASILWAQSDTSPAPFDSENSGSPWSQSQELLRPLVVWLNVAYDLRVKLYTTPGVIQNVHVPLTVTVTHICTKQSVQRIQQNAGPYFLETKCIQCKQPVSKLSKILSPRAWKYITTFHILTTIIHVPSRAAFTPPFRTVVTEGAPLIFAQNSSMDGATVRRSIIKHTSFWAKYSWLIVRVITERHNPVTSTE